eukprot:8998356-Karenia_brevis.AAC.1
MEENRQNCTAGCTPTGLNLIWKKSDMAKSWIKGWWTGSTWYTMQVKADPLGVRNKGVQEGMWVLRGGDQRWLHQS